MKRINLILVAIAMGVTAHAGELPLVEAVDPRKPSQDFEGTVTTQSGEKARVHVRTYGSEPIAMAREFGRRLAGRTYTDLNGMLLYKGMQLYKDQFFAKCFAQFALRGIPPSATMKKLLLFTTALVLGASMPLSSPGTQIVHDPGNAALNTQNLVQTTTTALKQVAAYAQQVQQYQLQLQQYANQLKNTLGVAKAAQVWQSAQQTMGSVMGTVNMFRSGGALQSYVENAKDVNYWLSSPGNQYTSQPANYWSTTQKTANDQMVQELEKQEQQMELDAQNLERLQQQAGSAAGQMQALTAANELAALEQEQLLQIRTLLVSQQQALAARNGTLASREAMQQAATQQLFSSPSTFEDHQGWKP